MSPMPHAALQEVAKIERNSVDPSFIKAGTLYVGLENIESGGRLINVRPVEPGELASSKFAFTARHLLYGKLRPYLAKIARPDFEGICSTDILPVLPGPELDRSYLAWLLLTPHMVELASSRATGANLPRLSPTALAELKIPVPPLTEQCRIAAILDKADSLRVKRRASLAQLDALTQSIFLDMFGDPTTNPRGLQIEPLGRHLAFVTSGGRGWAEFYATTGSRFIRSFDVQMNTIGNDDVAYVTAPDNAEARRTRVKAGDVLLTITGSRIGRVAPVPPELEGAYVSQHVAILRVDQCRIEPSYLSYFLSLGPGGQRQIARFQYGQTKPGLNFEQIKRFQIPIPPIEKQRQFAHRVVAVKRIETQSEASLRELDALFASIQHHAFR